MSFEPYSGGNGWVMGGGSAGGAAGGAGTGVLGGGVNDLLSRLFEEGETVETASVEAASLKDDVLPGALSPMGGLVTNMGMGVEVSTKVTGQVEEDLSCQLDNQSSVNHHTGHGFLDMHFQAMGNGHKQDVLELGFTGAMENVSALLSSGIPEGADAAMVVAGIEVGGCSIMDYEASVSQTSREEMQWLEENRELSSIGPAVQVQNQNVLPIDKDLASLGAGMPASVPVVEAGTSDEHLVSDDFRGNGDFVLADVGSDEVVEDIEMQTAGTHQVGENVVEKNDAFMADAGFVADILVVEAQSKDARLFDEKNNGKGDLAVSSSCSAVETQAAVAFPLDARSMEEGHVIVEDPIWTNICMPETSEPSEIQQLASQGKEFFVSIGDNQDMGALSAGSSASRSLDADAHEVGSSRGISQMDADASVLKEGLPATDEQEVELVQRSEAEQQTPSPSYTMEDVIADADVWIRNQALLEISDKQIPHRVARTPWTLCMEDNQKARYNLPPRETTEFSVSNLVWGKVKTHPWWPGQIFDHSDASELALKYQNKDNFLVAYFGDKSFAWRDKHQLKPFYASFSKMEKQSSSEAFICAVDDVLGEVSRRMELGLMCSCLPEEEHTDVKCQKVENAGIREGTNNNFDMSLVMNYFDHIRLLEYMRAVALIPTGGANRLELAIAKAQLKAFYHLKGYPELPEFISGRGLMDNGVEASNFWDKKPEDFPIEHPIPVSSESIPGKRKRGRPPKKQKHVLNDVELSTSSDKTPEEFILEHNTHFPSEMIPGKKKRGRPPKKKQKKLSRLTEEKNVSSLGNGSKNGSGVKYAGSNNPGKSKKGGLYLSQNLGSSFDNGECLHDSGKIKRERKEPVVNLGKKSESPTYFKVGEYIRRVASQLTGSSPIVKYQADTIQKSVSKVDHEAGVIDPDEFPSVPVADRRTKADITEDCPCPDEMLSQLCLAASDPLERCTVLPVVVSFITNYRNSFASISSYHNRKTGGKKGRIKAVEFESADTSPPDHMDFYWSDLISVDSSGKGQVSNSFERKGEMVLHKQKRKWKSAGKPEELLSQLCLAARGPRLEYMFLSMVFDFFTNFRNHCASNPSVGNKHSRKTGGKMEVESELNSYDMSTPDHMKDSYWSDMSSVNSTGQGQVSNNLKRKGKMVLQKQRRRKKSAEQSSPSHFLSPIRDIAQQEAGILSANMKPALASERSVISVEDKTVDTPTALVLSFNSLKSLPSKADLIRIFSRYGPLRESGTEVKRKTNRVKVVFRRHADAETAFSSAGKYSIFGPALLSYQLKYLRSTPKISPGSLTER